MEPLTAHFFLRVTGLCVSDPSSKSGVKTMKFAPSIFAAAAAVAFMIAPASASDINQLCIDTVTADGGDTSGCGCLADKAAGDADMTANLEMVAAMAAEERADHMSESTAAAIAECFPQPAAE